MHDTSYTAYVRIMYVGGWVVNVYKWVNGSKTGY